MRILQFELAIVSVVDSKRLDNQRGQTRENTEDNPFPMEFFEDGEVDFGLVCS